MLDTFEELEDLTPFLQREFVPRLDTGVRVVIAGRTRSNEPGFRGRS